VSARVVDSRSSHRATKEVGVRSTWMLVGLAVAALGLATAAGVNASARDADFFTPGNLLVSRSVYDAGPVALRAGSTVLRGASAVA
jgi:hypothetical protein